jgi:putative Flp pilus-assembly TadE/G-like protein
MIARASKWSKNSEQGAVTVIVAIVVIVMFAFTALAVDVARMYEERRELQRTADLAALAGAKQFFGGGTEADARMTAQCYVGDNSAKPACANMHGNPTVHHPGEYSGVPDPMGPCYNPPSDPGEDCVDAGYARCTVAGYPDPFDCVEARVRAPSITEDSENGFQFLFARVIGFTERPISAQARAVIGAGAPGGDRLVPWVLRDCPHPELASSYPEYAGEDDPAVITYGGTYGCQTGPSYGYKMSDDITDLSARVNLFLGDGESGNFQGGDLAEEPNCPQYNDGYFPPRLGPGADNYRDLLSGANHPSLPCVIAKGARMHAKTGAMPGPTQQGLNARGVSDSYCQAEFGNTIDPGDVVGDGIVSIEDYTNPCLVALVRVVHSEDRNDGDACPEHANLRNDVPGGQLIAEMEQHSDSSGGCDVLARFAALGASGSGGVSRPLVVRGFGLFYITEFPKGNKDPYRGLFMQALASVDAELDGTPCNPLDGICVVKLVP